MVTVKINGLKIASVEVNSNFTKCFLKEHYSQRL